MPALEEQLPPLAQRIDTQSNSTARTSAPAAADTAAGRPHDMDCKHADPIAVWRAPNTPVAHAAVAVACLQKRLDRLDESAPEHWEPVENFATAYD